MPADAMKQLLTVRVQPHHSKQGTCTGAGLFAMVKPIAHMQSQCKDMKAHTWRQLIVIIKVIIVRRRRGFIAVHITIIVRSVIP